MPACDVASTMADAHPSSRTAAAAAETTSRAVRRCSRSATLPTAAKALMTLATVGCCSAQMEERWLRDTSPPQCVFGDSLFCLASEGANTTATQLAKGLFYFMMYVLVCLVSSRYMNGVGSKWRSNFSGSLLLGMVVIQYYSVFMTAMQNYPYDGVEAYRWDCLQSTKGGKISRAMFYEGSERALNPCYCHANATCKYKSGVKEYNGSHPLGCPLTDEFTCLEQYAFQAFKTETETKEQRQRKRKVWPYIAREALDEGFRRDCKKGQAARCTRQDPCSPCELEKVLAFGVTRCETCSVFNNGDCNFVPGVGPYCWESPDYDERGGSRKVVPCKQCCTEPYQKDGTLLFDDEGYCV